MKLIFLIQVSLCVFVCTILSCSKQKEPPGTASLNIINALPGSTPYLLTNFSGTAPITWYSKALKLTYATQDKANQPLSSYSGEQTLAIYRHPDTTDKSAPLYNMVLNLERGNIHTLFLTGTLAAPDTLFKTDIVPYHPLSDSTLSIRFVNCSPGSAPVSVNITGRANGSEVRSLPYKGITDFKDYPATSRITNYNFEFRDAATGTLLGNLDVKDINIVTNINSRRFRNFTMVYMGLPSDATTRKIVLYDMY